jgi:3-deoxy-7-phosphoheptulonate synthase
MQSQLENLRIKESKVLLPPAFLEEEMPATDASLTTVRQARKQISDIIHGRDSRMLAIVGPCSIHDVEAAREYSVLLNKARNELADALCIVMRVYFEKPRTTTGWKGLINDPYLNESFRVNDGLRLARRLLLDLGEIGQPAGTEFLDMIIPQYLAGLVSWGAIGARTTECQLHRQLASGLSCPVGFKNGTSGDVQIAVDAIKSAAAPHTFLGHTKYGQSAIFVTSGNPDCHLILRGGRSTINYDAGSVADTLVRLGDAGSMARIMIDCSHANSHKNYREQKRVCREVLRQLREGQRRIFGMMLESNLVEGAQRLEAGKPLVYGQSVTDGCIGWEETLDLLRETADAVRQTQPDASSHQR